MAIKKSEIESAISTALICVIILLILIFGGMKAHHDEMDEGIMISMGDFDDGYGEHTPTPNPTPVTQTTSTPTKPVATNTVNEKLINQEDPSVALEREKRKKEQEEARKKAEEAERQAKILAEQEAKKNQISNLAGGAFKNTGKGSGTTSGDTNQGNPVGQGTQGGNSWSLAGRSLIGSLYRPNYAGNQEGIIVVDIRVDASGKVYSASINTSKTNISDERLRKESVDAALKNKFTSGNGPAMGTITYKFILN